ncbi:hypothetical protein BGL48_11970 [Salinivibrio sp. SS3]|uniref:HTH-type transcriptional regulator n=1 Tax=Salinivibrio phage SMHB1 TaxID=1897436 RepID=A0A1D9C9Q6_9CAUD|nr:hypothetical protein [Salinivibrio sp. BNH]YP_009786959.1 HTH-type transcriptional regulator [Salinivibrio phage SMHB1]AOY11822.1 HTH-type transcriptional regulator [Salinivibrio phage SMHB1]ODP98291.1 hypothetical protein BGL48_11970 [Salinivibrio sp. BNH]
MEKVKVLLEVEIDNKGDWLGLDDENGWQSYPGVNTPLDQFNKMAELENCSALNAILNMCDAETPSRFVSVSTDNAGGLSALHVSAKALEELDEKAKIALADAFKFKGRIVISNE